ncbi:hypothetical protein C7374_11717 [Falsochrobactrum ovis]|uniref:Uncharacterized protein n=1 Tax=Falsochrobactrum ovis TaxID=1293442 RepID=A0A364JSB8_9HYPH|nr:hypothetical protein C7374_11717 [Falsochrobactrum ovis]
MVSKAERGRTAGYEAVHDRRRIGETGGLDDHTVERVSLATAHHLLQLEQRGPHVAGCGAAEAAGRGHQIAFGALVDEIMIDRDRAELVDDDGGVPHPAVRQHLVEQRRLAGTEKSGQQRDGNRPLVVRND